MSAKPEDPSHEKKGGKDLKDDDDREIKEVLPEAGAEAKNVVAPGAATPVQAPSTPAVADRGKSSGERPSRPGLPAGISLKIFQNETDDQPEGPGLDEMPEEISADDIPAEQFINAWKKLAESRMEDSHGLFLAMTKYEPVLNKNGIIEVFLDNSIQQDLIAERRLEMLSYLRKELNNYALQIETRIRDNGLIQKAYLPKDKLERFIEKNPDIAELKKKLDLDFDY